MRFSSPLRSTDFSQLAMASAVSSPMPRTWRSCCREALEDGGGISEMFEQLPHPDRSHMLDQIQRHQRFPRIHGGGNTAFAFRLQGEVAVSVERGIIKKKPRNSYAHCTPERGRDSNASGLVRPTGRSALPGSWVNHPELLSRLAPLSRDRGAPISDPARNFPMLETRRIGDRRSGSGAGGTIVSGQQLRSIQSEFGQRRSL